ncbi:MAG: EAL domain-containing protein [Oceanicaulis sp.]
MRLRAAIFAVLVAMAAPANAAADPARYDAAVEEALAAMMRAPDEALAAAERAAQTLSDTAPGPMRAEQLARAGWLQAEALTRLGRPGEAAPVADRALERLGPDPDPTKLLADLKVARGRIAVALGDFDIAFISFTDAYDVYLQLGETRSQAIVLQAIGSIYTAAKQFDRALTYFSDAVDRYSDPSLDLAGLNNRANALRELGRYAEALVAYEEALQAAEALDSPMLEARILNNMAALHVGFEEYAAAERALRDAQARVSAFGAGEWTRFLDGVRAQIALGRGEHGEARTYLERTFDGVALDSSPQNFVEFHEAGVAIYAALGEWRAALDHLAAFKRLDDESRSVAASANSALLGAQFEFTEQELQIEQLRAERLEQNLALAGERARANVLALCALLAVIFAAAVIGFMRYRAEAARKRVLADALYRDGETGLPSRTALVRRLGRHAAKGLDFAVIAIEVDRHDHLRAALGFAAFAALERTLAERLSRDRDRDDVGVIAPGVLGVLLDLDTLDEGDDNALSSLVEGWRTRLCAPVAVDGLDIDASVTAGASFARSGDDDIDAEAVIKQALAAVDQARAHNSAFALFDKSLFGDPAANLAIMSRLNAALDNGEIALHYQPKLDLRTGAFTSAEALMRWTDPQRGYIPPDAYIPFAEETGHIRKLTEWSLERALIDQVALSKAGYDMAVAVNISSALLTDREFATRAARLAVQSRPGLIFEVTETAIMSDVDQAIRTLEMWTRAGVKIAIDDYGTGQSSLAYLKRLPASELKLDRAFIKDVCASQRDRMLVKSTADLAHNLGLTLTAEGVEDEETLSVLQLMGCDSAQGFGLCKPCGLLDLVGFMQRTREAEGAAITGGPKPARQGGPGA